MTSHGALVWLYGDGVVDMGVSTKCERIIAVSFEERPQGLSITQKVFRSLVSKLGTRNIVFQK